MRKILKNKCLYVFMAFALMFGLMFMVQTTVKAATPAPTGLKQTAAGENSVGISWNAVFGDNMHYYWRISDTNTFANARSDYEGSVKSSDCIASISGLQAGKTYYVQVGTSATKDYYKAPADTTWSAAISVVTTPVKVSSDTIVFTNATESSISLSWNAVEGATGYDVKYWRSSDKEDNAAQITVNTTAATIPNLTNNTKYSVKIYSFRQGVGFTATAKYGALDSNIPTLPTKVTGLNCTYFNPYTSKGTMSLEWDKKETANGYSYEIYAYNGKKPLVSGNANTCYVSVNKSKIKTNQIYKVRVRGYVNTTNNQRKYGKWSDYDYVSRCVATGTKLKKVSSGKIKVSWKKVKGATGYTIYKASKGSGKYKKVGTTKNTSYTFKESMKKNGYVYVRVLPYYKKGKKTYPATVNAKYQYSGYAHYYKSGYFFSYDY